MLVIEKKENPRSYDTIELLSRFASKEDTRKAMKCIYCDMEKGQFVSTDGRRLAIIPFKACENLAEKVKGSYSRSVSLSVKKQGSTFLLDLQETQFPNYLRVLPDKSNMGELMETLDFPEIKKNDDKAGQTCSLSYYRLVKFIDYPINYTWIKDFSGLSDLKLYWQVPGEFQVKPFILENNYITIAAMPLEKPD